ncbi:MAG: ammonium transporter [Acidimicrobiales bacterium]
MSSGDTAWLLVSAALVLFMTVGLAFFYGGLETERNVLDMLAMNFFTITLVTILWALLGFTLAFGPDVGHGFIGNLHFFALNNMGGVWPGTRVPKLAFMAFQMMFAIITPALVTGAIAGRMKFSAWITFCVAWSVVVYPVIAHWVFDPQGWIYRLGARDFAGGTVVHASAGAAALVLVLVLGPRSKESAAHYPTRSVPFVLLGAGILWFGWFGFNGGSALGANALAVSAFTTTQLAAASACLGWALLERVFTGKTTVIGMATGAVVGLATVTPASGYVGVVPALIIGVVASAACFAAVRVTTRFAKFDDTFGVAAVHGVGGCLGMLLLGLFAHFSINPAGLTDSTNGHINGLFFGDPSFLWHQVIAVVAVVSYTIAVTYLIAAAIKVTCGLRVSTTVQEHIGLGAAFDAAAVTNRSL